jgi:octaprenyl-diphosphate synthase
MVMPASAASPTSVQLMEQLGRLCRDRGLPDLATRLLSLQEWIQRDLHGFEAELATLPRGARSIHKAAHHLLDLGGKHLRPMCLAIAARFGRGFGDTARQLAVAVELVHSATLLHDDVVDLGVTRRGAAAARAVYGNAASVFAGDWLLIEALRRIRRAAVPGLLDAMLDTIEEMIVAESLQLERRGDVRSSAADYFRIVEGKTAALFRWAMVAGGRAGGLDDDRCVALERCGLRLGVAFQAVDDYLDFGGKERAMGKSLFADLREGKVTYPLILGMERDSSLASLLEQALADTAEGEPLPETARRQVLAVLERTGALADCRRLAHEQVAEAIAHLDALPDGHAKTALITVAEATIHREA